MPLPALIVAGSAVAAALVEHGQSGSLSHGLSDEQLWSAIAHRQNPLHGMPFTEAVLRDPRRVEGVMAQRVLQGMERAMGQRGDNPMMRMAYLDAARAAGGPGRSIASIVDVQEQNWEPYLHAIHQMGALPRPMRQRLRQGVNQIAQGFDQAIQVAVRASRIAQDRGREEEHVLWQRLAGAYRNMARAYLELIMTGELPQLIREHQPVVPALPPPDLERPMIIDARFEESDRFGAVPTGTMPWDVGRVLGSVVPDWAEPHVEALGGEAARAKDWPVLIGPLFADRDGSSIQVRRGERRRVMPGVVEVLEDAKSTVDGPGAKGLPLKKVKLVKGYGYRVASDGDIQAALWDKDLDDALSSFIDLDLLGSVLVPEPEKRRHEARLTRPVRSEAMFGAFTGPRHMQSGFRDTGARGGYGDPAEEGWRGDVGLRAAWRRNTQLGLDLASEGLRFNVPAPPMAGARYGGEIEDRLADPASWVG